MSLLLHTVKRVVCPPGVLIVSEPSVKPAGQACPPSAPAGPGGPAPPGAPVPLRPWWSLNPLLSLGASGPVLACWPLGTSCPSSLRVQPVPASREDPGTGRTTWPDQVPATTVVVGLKELVELVTLFGVSLGIVVEVIAAVLLVAVVVGLVMGVWASIEPGRRGDEGGDEHGGPGDPRDNGEADQGSTWSHRSRLAACSRLHSYPPGVLAAHRGSP